MTDSVALELEGDTLLLDDLPNGIICTRVDLGWPDLRQVAQARPQADGTLDQTEHFGARAVTLNVTAVSTDDGYRFYAMLARLARYLGAAARPTLLLTVENIAYRMGLAPDQAGAVFEHQGHANAQLQFRAPDPYLYTDLKAVGTAGYEASTSGRTYPLVHPREYPPQTGSSGIVEAVNAGAVDVWPVVRIRGPLATSFRLENITTGESFEMATSTVDTGQWLEIDMLERTVNLNGDPSISRFSSIAFGTSTWLHLEPGTNLIRYVPGAVSASTAEVEWADPYLWPDHTIPEA